MNELLQKCEEALVPFAAREHTITEPTPDDWEIEVVVTAADVRRAHSVWQEVSIALMKIRDGEAVRP